MLIEADSGKVLEAENATYPWYPASVTKLMTLYTTLKAVKDGRITLDTLFTVSPIAASQSPTKMGFRPGTQVTVDNALKMMMVRSANDMAVLLAEGVDGSIENFCDEMNANAAKLGMTQTSYVNPNGLPADGQITSARDMAILARAIVKELPEYEYFVHIPAIRFGQRVTRNYNSLIGRYPGADGMKTGFICASGFNLVASATRNGRRLIAVVLGAPSSAVRAAKAAQLLETGFDGNCLAWLPRTRRRRPVAADRRGAAEPARRHLRPKRKRPGVEDDDTNVAGNSGGAAAARLAIRSSPRLQPPTLKPSEMLAMAPAPPSRSSSIPARARRPGTDRRRCRRSRSRRRAGARKAAPPARSRSPPVKRRTPNPKQNR